MGSLLILKERLIEVYNEFQMYITGVLKGIVALVMLLMINGMIGYTEGLSNLGIIIIASVICAFLPEGSIVLLGSAYILGNLSSLGLEVAAVAAAIFLFMFLVYLRIAREKIIVVVLTMVSFYLGIPYAAPLILPLLMGPSVVLTMGFGVVIYYFINNIHMNAVTINGLAGDAGIEKVRIVTDGIIANDAMIISLICFSFCFFIVYAIRKSTIDYAWPIAIATGATALLVMILVASLLMGTSVDVTGMVIATVASILVTSIVAFLFMGVDYTRVEKVQFEDDEYYYYVKAVPKMSLQAKTNRVKKINVKRK